MCGKSFHWFDQDLILKRAHEVLVDGGVFAIVSGVSLWNGEEPWQLAAKEVIQKYLGRKRKYGKTKLKNHLKSKKYSYSDLLEESDFGKANFNSFSYELKWEIEQLLGYLYSTSFSAKHLYGDRLGEFEREMRIELGHNFDSSFTQQVVTDLHWARK